MARFKSHRHVTTVEKIYYIHVHVVSTKKRETFKVHARTQISVEITYSVIYMLNFGNSGNHRS